MIGEYETFYATAFKTGDSIVITIPVEVVKFMGLDRGEQVKVMIKKA